MSADVTVTKAATPRSSYEDGVILSPELPVVVFDGFITPQECTALIEQAEGRMGRARVSLDESSAVVAGRSGDNCWLGYQENPLVRRIGERVAKRVGLPLAHAEAFQVLRYSLGSEYRAHYDAYDLNTARGRRCCRRGGQRIVTALLYLSAVEEGGATAFPRLGIEVDPVPGRLVVFNNVADDPSMPHPDSLHAGLPVSRGEKWAGNFWFHQHPMSRIVFPSVEVREGTADTVAPSDGNNRPVIAEEQEEPSAHAPAVLRTNRASRVLEKAFFQACGDVGEAAQGVRFTYWDTYGGNVLEESAQPDCGRVLCLVDRAVTNPLANKRSLARLLADHGLSDLAPPTFESVAAAQQVPGWQDRLWFVKEVHGTGGKGMFCVRGSELGGLELHRNQVVQAGVEDICLIDGRKFSARVYVLVWNGAVYFYNDGFAVIHGQRYEPGSTDYAVQIDHRGYERADSPVGMMRLAHYESWQDHVPALLDGMGRLSPLWAPTVAASTETDYAVFGLDFLFCKGGAVCLLEVNNMPNFIHSRVINEEVNTPFWREVMAMLMVGAETGAPRLIRVSPRA